jgi:hypothetical protein
MDIFIDTYDHPKLKQEDIRSVTQNKIEATIEPPKNEKSRT